MRQDEKKMGQAPASGAREVRGRLEGGTLVLCWTARVLRRAGLNVPSHPSPPLRVLRPRRVKDLSKVTQNRWTGQHTPGENALESISCWPDWSSTD